MASTLTTFAGIKEKLRRDIRTLCRKHGAMKIFQELIDDLEEYLALAEVKLNRDLRIPAMEQQAVLTTSNGAAAVPTDLLSIKMIETNETDTPPLKEKDADYLASLSDDVDTPCFWARKAQTLVFKPVPSDGTQLDMIYYKSLTPLSDSNTTNWFSTNASDVLRDAALSELIMMINEDLSEHYEQKYQQSKAQVQAMSEKVDFQGASLQQHNRSETP